MKLPEQKRPEGLPSRLQPRAFGKGTRDAISPREVEPDADLGTDKAAGSPETRQRWRPSKPPLQAADPRVFSSSPQPGLPFNAASSRPEVSSHIELLCVLGSPEMHSALFSKLGVPLLYCSDPLQAFEVCLNLPVRGLCCTGPFESEQIARLWRAGLGRDPKFKLALLHPHDAPVIQSPFLQEQPEATADIIPVVLELGTTEAMLMDWWQADRVQPSATQSPTPSEAIPVSAFKFASTLTPSAPRKTDPESRLIAKLTSL
ncbi:MAG: hypothetical protein ACAI34_11940 [Verrucomicrobium sp.]|nr:hypothetical protein [Verrucomicrobium sp.]